MWHTRVESACAGAFQYRRPRAYAWASHRVKRCAESPDEVLKADKAQWLCFTQVYRRSLCAPFFSIAPRSKCHDVSSLAVPPQVFRRSIERPLLAGDPDAVKRLQVP